MTKDEVKDLIGENNWDLFCQWMTGQTVGTYPDGSTDYYDCDVNAFKEKIESGYDRQQDPLAWD